MDMSSTNSWQSSRVWISISHVSRASLQQSAPHLKKWTRQMKIFYWQRKIYKGSILLRAPGVLSARASSSRPRTWPEIVASSYVDNYTQKSSNLDALKQTMRLQYLAPSAYKGILSVVDAESMSARPSSSFSEKKSNDSKLTTERCRRKCLLRLVVTWKKSWLALASSMDPASATIIRGVATMDTITTHRCLSKNNSDRSSLSSR